MELTCAAPIAIAIVDLTLFCVIALVLIPLLDDELRRRIARVPANDNRPAAVAPTAVEPARIEARTDGAR